MTWAKWIVVTAQHIFVIGAGFGGIAAALRMRAKGHRVTLVERLDARRPRPGLRARRFSP